MEIKLLPDLLSFALACHNTYKKASWGSGDKRKWSSNGTKWFYYF